MKAKIQKAVTYVLVGFGIAALAMILGLACVGFDVHSDEWSGWSIAVGVLLISLYVAFGAPEELFCEGRLKRELRETKNWCARLQGDVHGQEHKIAYQQDYIHDLNKELTNKCDELKLSTLHNEFLEAKVKELLRWQVEHMTAKEAEEGSA